MQPGQQIVGGKRVENMTEERMMKRQIGRIKGKETMQGLEGGLIGMKQTNLCRNTIPVAIRLGLWHC